MFNGILACRKFLKSDIYVTNIYLLAPISSYSFIVQASINRCSLFHFQGSMCLKIIFSIFNKNLFILMWCLFIFFRVTWEWILILFMYYFFYFTYFRTRWFMGLLLLLLLASCCIFPLGFLKINIFSPKLDWKKLKSFIMIIGHVFKYRFHYFYILLTIIWCSLFIPSHSFFFNKITFGFQYLMVVLEIFSS